MSAKQKTPYSQKHAPDFRPDPAIETEMRHCTANQEISCAAAFEIATRLHVGPEEVGRTADVMDIAIVKCQLGLFGYKPEKKIITAEETPHRALNDAIAESSANHRLSCAQAWQIASQYQVSKLTVSNTCQAKGIKIKNCRLGAF